MGLVYIVMGLEKELIVTEFVNSMYKQQFDWLLNEKQSCLNYIMHAGPEVGNVICLLCYFDGPFNTFYCKVEPTCVLTLSRVLVDW